MFIGYLFKISGTVVGLFIPKIMAHILDEIVPSVKLNENYIELLLWSLLMIACALIDRFCNVFANQRAALASTQAVNKLRYDLYEKMLTLSGRQTDKVGIPSLVSRLTSDSYNIHTCFNIFQRMGVRATILLFGGLAISATLDPIMTLTFVATLPFVFAIVFTISRRGVPFYTKVQSSVDGMVRVMREDVSGIRVIKALSKEDYERERFDKANTDTVKNELKASGIMAASGPFISLCMNMGLVLVIVVGAYRVNIGAAKPGVVVAFLTYFTIILNAVISVNRIFIIYSKASASAKRVFEIIDSENDLLIEKLPEDYRENADAPIVEFKNVYFSYGDIENEREISEEKYVLSDVSFKLNKGETLGIIGATGAGKTTIISLLMRYYDVTKGEILINGRNIKTYDLSELRTMFGTAFQNNVIFADTIRENISFGRDLSEEEIVRALTASDAYRFVKEKEGELDHVASIKGADFSGGQKQRMYVARALAGKSEIIVLDDSASALDYKTDAKIRENLRNDYSSSTLITIAQRISSVMKMDNIIVLEDGKITAQGNHEELMASSEIYKEIAATQLGSLS
ncbi:MAG: ABC transporter ATP-binding protein/permease [Lachnospiraceae bacterium]|nr:ABC transporter ATP-binding protein/permease [Lachnospiraceae bacterium]